MMILHFKNKFAYQIETNCETYNLMPVARMRHIIHNILVCHSHSMPRLHKNVEQVYANKCVECGMPNANADRRQIEELKCEKKSNTIFSRNDSHLI